MQKYMYIMLWRYTIRGPNFVILEKNRYPVFLKHYIYLNEEMHVFDLTFGGTVASC